MHIGILTLELRLDGCRSLKEKRHVVRGLVDRLRHTFGASVAEVAHQNSHTRAQIGAALVSGDRKLAARMVEQMIDFAESNCSAEIVRIESEVLTGEPMGDED